MVQPGVASARVTVVRRAVLFGARRGAEDGTRVRWLCPWLWCL